MSNHHLFEAIDQHDVERVKTLIEQGDSIESPQQIEPHWRPLEAAIEELQTRGSIEVVRLLIEAGADVNSWDLDHSLTPLHCAVFSDNYEATELLLKHGADPTSVSDEGHTALKHPAEAGNLQLAKLLLQYGAGKNINFFGGPCGMNALSIAVKNLDYLMVDLLVDAGADVEALDADGQPPQSYLPPRNQSDSTKWKATINALNRALESGND